MPVDLACSSLSRAPLGQSERGHRRSPHRSCLILLPSRATPYLAPAAGTIVTALPLARASRQRERLTLPNSADRSVSQVPTPIQGTKKPKHSPQAIIRQRHRCRRLASSVVLIVTPASASRGTDRRPRHHRRSSPTNHRRRPPCGGPPAVPRAPHKPLTQVALCAGRSRMLIAVHGLRSVKASETIEDPLNEVD